MIPSGTLLIADPYLQDSYFTRTVVYLTNYGPSDTMGFILNKPSNVMVHELLEDFPEFNALVYHGGPVDSNLLFFIHKLGEQLPGAVKVSDHVWVGGDLNTLKELVAEGKVSPKDIRFFLGYAGWGDGQLEEEIADKTWVLGEFDPVYLYTLKYRAVWGSALKQNKKEYAFYSKFAFTPSLN